MHKTTRRGFTLVEMMVVLSIIAVTFLLGVLAAININNANVVDRGAQEIVTAIRESQNKAISVANAPDGTIPLAWGVSVDATSKTAQPFYLGTDKVYYPIPGSIYNYDNLANVTTTADSLYFFTTPFGKYYSTVDLNAFNTQSWAVNDQRPRDILPSNSTPETSTITLEYRNNTKTVTVEANGDVHVD